MFPNALAGEGIWAASGVNSANVAMTATETITQIQECSARIHWCALSLEGDKSEKTEVSARRI
ncbi:MAG: C69 family dipeptidase [Coprococcus sp.]